MELGADKISLLYASSSRSGNSKGGVYDLVAGTDKDITASLLSSAFPESDYSPTSLQNSALDNLESFVKKNFGEADAKSLLGDIVAIRKLGELTAQGKASLDPVFSMLALNPALRDKLPAGSIINVLF